MACSIKVSPAKTFPERSVCGRYGRVYEVSGLLVGMTVELCSAHKRTLRRLGLTVELATPIEQLAGKAETQRAAGLRTIAKPGEPGYPQKAVQDDLKPVA